MSGQAAEDARTLRTIAALLRMDPVTVQGASDLEAIADRVSPLTPEEELRRNLRLIAESERRAHQAADTPLAQSWEPDWMGSV